MIPQSELIACRDCGLVFWRKAGNMKTSKGKEICPHCESRDTDMIDRAS